MPLADTHPTVVVGSRELAPDDVDGSLVVPVFQNSQGMPLLSYVFS